MQHSNRIQFVCMQACNGISSTGKYTKKQHVKVAKVVSTGEQSDVRPVSHHPLLANGGKVGLTMHPSGNEKEKETC